MREPHEYKICSLPGTTLIPLGEVAKRLSEVPKDLPIIVHCKSGGRSAKACDLLRQSGYKNVLNMKGGTLLWSDKVDPSVAKY